MLFRKTKDENGEDIDNNIVYNIVMTVVLLSLIAVSFTLFFPLGIVGAGERGVLLNFGAVSHSTKNEGLYFKVPVMQKVVIMDVRTQKEQTEADAASKDLQTVKSVIALNFHLSPNYVAQIYQEVGTEYQKRIIDPAIQEAVKAVTAKFTAEELITKREIVRDEIKVLLKEKLEPRGMMIDEFNIVNFDFSESFNAAIEAKVTAEQSALAAKNKLEQVKFEAQQAVEAAEGKAKAIQIEGDALKSNPNVTELRWIEKWNGQVPTYWGSASPFIGLNK